jgi:hypothetical protein
MLAFAVGCHVYNCSRIVAGITLAVCCSNCRFNCAPVFQVNPFKTHRIDPPSTTVTTNKDELLQYFRRERHSRATQGVPSIYCNRSMIGASHTLLLAGRLLQQYAF